LRCRQGYRVKIQGPLSDRVPPGLWRPKPARAVVREQGILSRFPMLKGGGTIGKAEKAVKNKSLGWCSGIRCDWLS
jgi:hypothetical protein